MKSAIVLLLMMAFVSSFALAQAPNTLTAQEQKEGWVLLFDGKTLNGWQALGGANPWKVADGAIVTDGPPTECWLGTNQEYRDFVLRLEFQAPEKTNSGIFLRSKKEGSPAETGYELQIWDFPPHAYFTGGFVQVAKANPHIRFKADEWNRYEVTFQGDHYIVLLNGQKVNDVNDSRSASGLIGLQSNKTLIKFRSIKVRKLN
ncbi:MAG: DUF1080 domain-containing protein [Candidatus Korobacteraceae bacterium]